MFFQRNRRDFPSPLCATSGSHHQEYPVLDNLLRHLEQGCCTAWFVFHSLALALCCTRSSCSKPRLGLIILRQERFYVCFITFYITLQNWTKLEITAFCWTLEGLPLSLSAHKRSTGIVRSGALEGTTLSTEDVLVVLLLATRAACVDRFEIVKGLHHCHKILNTACLFSDIALQLN